MAHVIAHILFAELVSHLSGGSMSKADEGGIGKAKKGGKVIKYVMYSRDGSRTNIVLVEEDRKVGLGQVEWDKMRTMGGKGTGVVIKVLHDILIPRATGDAQDNKGEDGVNDKVVVAEGVEVVDNGESVLVLVNFGIVNIDDKIEARAEVLNISSVEKLSVLNGHKRRLVKREGHTFQHRTWPVPLYPCNPMTIPSRSLVKKSRPQSTAILRQKRFVLKVVNEL